MTTEHADGTIMLPLNFSPNYFYFTLNLSHVYIYGTDFKMSNCKKKSEKNT